MAVRWLEGCSRGQGRLETGGMEARVKEGESELWVGPEGTYEVSAFLKTLS